MAGIFERTVVIPTEANGVNFTREVNFGEVADFTSKINALGLVNLRGIGRRDGSTPETRTVAVALKSAEVREHLAKIKDPRQFVAQAKGFLTEVELDYQRAVDIFIDYSDRGIGDPGTISIMLKEGTEMLEDVKRHIKLLGDAEAFL